MGRAATICRQTRETSVELTLELDGQGVAAVATGIGFLDHMLILLAAHGRFDLSIRAAGDHHVDDHHTVEDVGICLGSALAQALGERRGIRRFGDCTLPMDEALVTTAVDLGGRPALVWRVDLPSAKIGAFDAPLAEEFWNAVVIHGKLNFHALLHHGRNGHHILEAVFKSAARALRAAVENDPRLANDIPSTKGIL